MFILRVIYIFIIYLLNLKNIIYYFKNKFTIIKKKMIICLHIYKFIRKKINNVKLYSYLYHTTFI